MVEIRWDLVSPSYRNCCQQGSESGEYPPINQDESDADEDELGQDQQGKSLYDKAGKTSHRGIENTRITQDLFLIYSLCSAYP